MNEQTTIDFEAAHARAEQGIQSSAEHAEADQPRWGEQALQYVAAFAKDREESFTMEQCRVFAYFLGLPVPAEERSWGSVTQTAVRRKIITKTGKFAPAASSNGSPKPLYLAAQ